MPRMRTAKQVIEIIREEDPDSAVSLNFIRNLINSGKLPVVCAGKKKLINVDAVLEYIANGEQPATNVSDKSEHCKIRAVHV